MLQNTAIMELRSVHFTPHLYHPSDHPQLFRWPLVAFSTSWVSQTFVCATDATPAPFTFGWSWQKLTESRDNSYFKNIYNSFVWVWINKYTYHSVQRWQFTWGIGQTQARSILKIRSSFFSCCFLRRLLSFFLGPSTLSSVEEYSESDSVSCWYQPPAVVTAFF